MYTDGQLLMVCTVLANISYMFVYAFNEMFCSTIHLQLHVFVVEYTLSNVISCV